MPYYVLDNFKRLHEGMTKEEILAAIVEAVETHEISDVDSGFVTTVKEQNAGLGLKFWIGTTAEYNALTEIDPLCVYIPTDSTDLQDLSLALSLLTFKVNRLETMKGKVLLDQTIGYGDSLSVALSGTAIKYFAAVKVRVPGAGDVLCSVQVNPDSDTIQIKGSAPASLSSENALTLINVNLSCSKSNNTLTRNRTTTATFLSGTTLTAASISQITGIY